MKPSPTEAFADLLEGRSEGASSEVAALAKLASALAPPARPEPSSSFKARIRSELLAAASAIEEEEIERFAVALDHPAPVEEARELVAVAAALEQRDRPVPSPAFRYGLRNQLVSKAARPAVGGRVAAAVDSINARMRRSLRTVMATGLVATLLAGTSASFAAASGSLPTDDLYPLKRFREAAALAVHSGPAKGFLYLEDARIRLREVRDMTRLAIRDPKPYVDTLDDMDSETIAGETIIIDSFKHSTLPREAVERVSSFARIQVADLSVLLDRIPEPAQPRARDSLIVAARVAYRADNILRGCPCPSNALEQPPATSGNTSDALGCSCSTTPGTTGGSSDNGGTDGGMNGGSPPGNTGGNDNGGNGGNDGSDNPTKDVPDVPGTTQDDELKQLIDDLLNSVPPAPSATDAPLPVETPTLPITLPSGL